MGDTPDIFDLLEPLSKALIERGGPNIRAGFARMTGGVDIPFIIEAIAAWNTRHNPQRTSDHG